MPTPAGILCPTCSTELISGAAFCYRCGSQTPANFSDASLEYRAPPPGSEAERRAAIQRLVGDGFELRDLIGRGGFADVFQLWDKRLKRSLALKTLRDDLETSDALLERFRREAEAIALVRHPNIVPIYTVGGDGGVAYFVMPMIDGESLAARLQRESKLAVDEAVRILRECAGALGAAHAHGMVHRDVKPENIMLDGKARRVLVMDFGIAKSVGPGEAGLTGTGILIGTPQFMSPEQAAGDRSVDHRTDQYALAVVGYRMLSGRMPVDGDNIQTIIFKQIAGSLTPLTNVAPDVPLSLVAVIERALATNPAERFESMDAFVRALDAAAPGIATTGSRRLRATDWPVRMSAMRKVLPGWRSPITVGAVALAAVGAWLSGKTFTASGAELAANRGEAEFAAKAFLASRGGTPPFAERVYFEAISDTTFNTLSRAKGPGTVDSIMQLGQPMWNWHVDLRSARPAGIAPVWQVDVGLHGRVVGYRILTADSVTAEPVARAAAERIAVGELARLYPDAGSFRRLPDSTITLRHRQDFIFRWSRTRFAFPLGADTAKSIIHVRVMGSTVIRVVERWELPRFDGKGQAILIGLIGLGLVASFIVGGWMLVVQMRRDELRWGMALKIGGAISAVSMAIWVAGEGARLWFMSGVVEGASSSSIGTVASTQIIGFGLLAVILAAGVVLLESLSAEMRPTVFAGLSDLGTGKFSTPEYVASVAAGALGGVFLLVVHSAVSYVAFRVTGAQAQIGLPAIATAPIPALQALGRLSSGLIQCMLLALLQLAVYKWRASDRWAILLPMTLLVAAQALPPSGVTTPGERAQLVALMLILPVMLWRYGILATALSIALLEAVPGLVLLFQLSSDGSAPALFATLVLAAPFALGIVAYRRVNADPKQGMATR